MAFTWTRTQNKHTQIIQKCNSKFLQVFLSLFKIYEGHQLLFIQFPVIKSIASYASFRSCSFLYFRLP